GVAQVMTVSLTNQGAAALEVAGARLSDQSDSAFTRLVDQSTCGGATLQPGQSCSTRIQFRPTSVGTYNGSVVFTDDSGGVAGSTQAVQLTGTVLVPGIDANPNAVTFGDTAAGAITGAQQIAVHNTGTGPLTITGVSRHGAGRRSFVLAGQTC